MGDFGQKFRMAPGRNQVRTWLRPSAIKSIQRGTITITGAASVTATINAVVLANSTIRYLGQTYSQAAATEQRQAFSRVELTNTTTVTGIVNTSPGAESTVVSFEVTEYFPGVIRSVQRGTIVGAATAAITSVNTARAELSYLGHTESASDGITQYMPNLVLTNATTVTQSVVVSAATTSGYQVLEWW
jgi:hypothetical protein